MCGSFYSILCRRVIAARAAGMLSNPPNSIRRGAPNWRSPPVWRVDIGQWKSRGFGLACCVLITGWGDRSLRCVWSRRGAGFPVTCSMPRSVEEMNFNSYSIIHVSKWKFFGAVMWGAGRGGALCRGPRLLPAVSDSCKRVFAIIHIFAIILALHQRGYSSAGRALAWHARGQRFDPAYLHHQRKRNFSWRFVSVELQFMVPIV
jgi:hypothetical protein